MMATRRNGILKENRSGVRAPATSRKPATWTGIDRDYEALRTDMPCLFRRLGIDTSGRRIDNILPIGKT